MKIFLFLLLFFTTQHLFAQQVWILGGNTPLGEGLAKGVIKTDSGYIPAYKQYMGAFPHLGISWYNLLDSSYYYWNGVIAKKMSTSIGTVRQVNSGYGLLGGPITDSGTLKADTATLNTALASTLIAGYGLLYSTRSYKLDSAIIFTDIINTIGAGAGISISGRTITNTAPDQTVVLNAGYGVTPSGTYPNFTLTLDTTTAFTKMASTLAAGYGLNYSGRTFKEDTVITFPALWSTIVAGSGVTISGRTISATGTGGTVTNVIGGTNISITGTSTIQPTVNISGTIGMGNGGTGATTTTSLNTTPINYGGNTTITAAPSGSAGGDLTGTYPNPTITPSVGLTGTPTTPNIGYLDNGTTICNTAYANYADKYGDTFLVSPTAGISNTETVVLSSKVLAANRLVNGTHIRYTLVGTCSTTATTANAISSVRIGTGGSILDGLMATFTNTGGTGTNSNIPFTVTIDLWIHNTGSSGSCTGKIDYVSQQNLGISNGSKNFTNQLTYTTFNTTTANLIISYTYQSTSSGMTATFTDGTFQFVDK